MTDLPAVLSDTAAADAASVSAMRTLLAQWLDAELDLDPERHADVVLAADEALSNCADHAYVDAAQTGTITMHAHHDPVREELHVRVTDHGTWTDSTPSPVQPAIRGRGVPLMRALADAITIDGTPSGTTVRLTFRRCRAAARVT